MKLFRYAILSLCMFLTSCSYITSSSLVKSHEKNYLRAYSVPPLRVPPGLKSDAFQTSYPIPDRNYPAVSKNVSLVPPGLTN